MKVKQSLKKLAKDFNSYIRYARYKYKLDRAFGKEDLEINSLNRFVIFSVARSGTTLLCSRLNSHPEILCHYELFAPNMISYAPNFQKIYGGDREISREDLTSGRIGIDTVEGRERSPESFIVKVWQHNFGHKAVGFKVIRGQNQNAVDLLVRDKNVKKILLLRQNKIRCYISRLIVEKTGVWSISKDGFAYKNGKIQKEENIQISSKKVTVNVDKFNKWSKEYDRYFEQLRQRLVDTNQSFVELTYEDLIGEKSESVNSKLLEFIGVSAQFSALQEISKQQNSEKLSDLISNFDELKEKLVGTELELMLLD